MRFAFARKRPPEKTPQLDNMREQIARLIQDAHERLDKMIDRLQRREKERVT